MHAESGKMYENKGDVNLLHPMKSTLLEDILRLKGTTEFDSDLKSSQWKIEISPASIHKGLKSFKINFLINPKE
jgi:hypothetical protein